jgi:dihydropteroate synthase
VRSDLQGDDARRERLARAIRPDNDGLPRLMGILNVTPDSFHVSSRVSGDEAVKRGLQMFEAGATWVDVGGESTRPGAEPVSHEEEMARVLPVIRQLKAANPEGLVSIDTRHGSVASAAIQAGADMINDVSGLRDPGMMDVAVNTGAAVCIMHMQGTPQTMQDDVQYDAVVLDVHAALFSTASELVARGHPSELVCLDPGIGFGKEHHHNLALLDGGEDLTDGGQWAVLWGVSRKSVVGHLTGHADPEDRLPGTLGLAALACLRGVGVLRVHDVEPHRDMLAALRPFNLKG